MNITTPEEVCDHYPPEAVSHIPTIQQSVKAALDVLSKDDDGSFLMYEQGDIDWAAHGRSSVVISACARSRVQMRRLFCTCVSQQPITSFFTANHMDDMLGAMLDIDDSVRIIMDWIQENGGYEKNALVCKDVVAIAGHGVCC